MFVGAHDASERGDHQPCRAFHEGVESQDTQVQSDASDQSEANVQDGHQTQSREDQLNSSRPQTEDAMKFRSCHAGEQHARHSVLLGEEGHQELDA